MADDYTYSTIPDSDQYDEISHTLLEETLLPHEVVRSTSPSVTSSIHANNKVNCIMSHVRDLSTKIEHIVPTCMFMERTENMIAVIWGAVIFFISILFVIAQFNSRLEMYSFTTTYIVLCTFMLISIIVMSVAIHYRKSKRFLDRDGIEEFDNLTTDGDTRYLIVTSYIFSVGNFLLDMFSILTVFHCGLSLAASFQKQKYAAKFIYHSLRLIFVAIQLVFMQIFGNGQVRRAFRFPYKVLIAHVIVTNFSVWFSFLCQETGILSKTTYEPEGEYIVLNCTSNQQDGVFLLAKTLTSYLSPFVFQFSLLSAAMFYTLYPGNAVQHEEPDHRRKYNYGAIDPVKRDNSKIYRFHPAYLSGILIGLLLILSSWTLQDNVHYIYNLRFSYAMQIIIHLLMMLASVYIFKEMRCYHAKRYEKLKYRVDDYLLLSTGIGGFLPFLFMVVFSVLKVNDYGQKVFIIHGIDILKGHQDEIRVLLCVLAVLNVISVLTQTVVILNAHSYKRVPFAFKPTDSSTDLLDEREHYTKLRSSARIGQWLIFLLLLNLSMWIVTSTFELDYGIRTTYFVPSVYWSSKLWAFITRLLYPVLIFYRIHSVAMLAWIWMSFRIKKKTI